MKLFNAVCKTSAYLSGGDVMIEQTDNLSGDGYIIAIPIELLPILMKALRQLAKEAKNGE